MFRIKTDLPVAINSPDHIYPHGTRTDNNTNLGYIEEVEKMFGKPVKVLDLGCAGGQLIVDFVERGNIALGLEGSDYCIKNKRENWVKYYNKNLFIGSISEPFEIYYNEQPIKFNLISAWEVIEHIAEDKLDNMFENIYNHLEDDGIFVGSISFVEDVHGGYRLHQSVFPKEWWYNKMNKWFVIEPYCFKNVLRQDAMVDGSSFIVTLKKKKLNLT